MSDTIRRSRPVDRDCIRQLGEGKPASRQAEEKKDGDRVESPKTEGFRWPKWLNDWKKYTIR